MNDPYSLEEEYFTAALALPANERAAFLRRVCGDDHSLLERLEALLAGHERAEFLEHAPERELADAARAAAESPAPDEAPGTRVGRYTIVAKLGEGGCGTVFRAEQTDPVRRTVALKVIKLGMDTRSVVARFAAERQALARMNHPHIARVFDGGSTETGRPFFAMELVTGVRITDYSDRQRLNVDDRLRLFASVCEAVQHAHQKGVIHRDLKPSNILVATEGGRPAPKIIDFGIAKATQGRLTEATALTTVEQLIGTPVYMSPEQAASGETDIDTRSDIYSLGVLLHELLTGTTPLDAAQIKVAGVDEVRRRIREHNAPLPSVRLRSLDPETQAATAEKRSSDPRRLLQRLRGDLDWIVTRCLEKDRARRYGSADALAREIERHLRSEPVSARPPRLAYIAAKFIRRHRIGFATGTAVAATLVAGAAVSTTLYLRADAARERALLAEREQSRLRVRAEASEATAKTEAARSAQVAQFVQDMFNNLNLAQARGRDTQLLRDILDATEQRLQQELKSQPEIEAELRDTIGRAYGALHDYGRAEASQRRAFELREQLLGPDHLKTIESLDGVGIALQYQDRRDEARKVFRDALARRRRSSPEETLDLAWAIMRVARAAKEEGKLDEAEAMFREELRIKRRLLPADDWRILDAEKQLADLLRTARRLPEAEAAYRDLLARTPPTELNYENGSRALLLSDFGSVLLQRRKFAEAEACLRESLELHRNLYAGDETHPRAFVRISVVLRHLGTALTRQSRWNEAEVTFREVLARSETELAGQPQSTVARQAVANSHISLSEICRQQQRPAEAEANARKALALLRPLPRTLANLLPEALLLLGQALALQEHWTEAEASFREALPADVQRGGFMHGYAIAHGWLESIERPNRREEIAAVIDTIIAAAHEAVRIHGFEVGSLFACELAQALVAHRHHAAGESLAREMLARWEEHRRETWQGPAFRVVIGDALLGERRYGEAESYLREGYHELERASDRMPAGTGDLLGHARRLLERLLLETHRPAEAAALRRPVAPAASPTP